MVESEFILLGTDRDASGIPWALLASDHDGDSSSPALPFCTSSKATLY
jgi:hypothetical protein